MNTTPTRQYQRIEETRYGDSQHEVAIRNPEETTSVERARYGGPQHDADRKNPDEVHRLAYEDDHWRERRTTRSDQSLDRTTGGGQSSDSGPASRIDPTEERNKPETEPSRNPDISALLA